MSVLAGIAYNIEQSRSNINYLIFLIRRILLFIRTHRKKGATQIPSLAKAITLFESFAKVCQDNDFTLNVIESMDNTIHDFVKYVWLHSFGPRETTFEQIQAILNEAMKVPEKEAFLRSYAPDSVISESNISRYLTQKVLDEFVNKDFKPSRLSTAYLIKICAEYLRIFPPLLKGIVHYKFLGQEQTTFGSFHELQNRFCNNPGTFLLTNSIILGKTGDSVSYDLTFIIYYDRHTFVYEELFEFALTDSDVFANSDKTNLLLCQTLNNKELHRLSVAAAQLSEPIPSASYQSRLIFYSRVVEVFSEWYNLYRLPLPLKAVLNSRPDNSMSLDAHASGSQQNTHEGILPKRYIYEMVNDYLDKNGIKVNMKTNISELARQISLSVFQGDVKPDNIRRTLSDRRSELKKKNRVEPV